jgi:hypothetical protein
MVLGEEATGWLDRHDVDARLVSTDGTVTRTGRWPVQGLTEVTA